MLGGVVLVIESQKGTELATKSSPFDAFLASLGKTRADFTLSHAYSQGGLKAQVGAWRVKGRRSRIVAARLQTAVRASSTTPLTQTEETLAGRAITRIGAPVPADPRPTLRQSCAGIHCSSCNRPTACSPKKPWANCRNRAATARR